MRVRVSEFVQLLRSALSRNTHDYGIRLYQRGGSGSSCLVRRSTSSLRWDVVYSPSPCWIGGDDDRAGLSSVR